MILERTNTQVAKWNNTCCKYVVETREEFRFVDNNGAPKSQWFTTFGDAVSWLVKH